MWNYKRSVNLSLYVCYVLSAVLIILAVAGYWIFDIYMTGYRGFLPEGEAIESIKRIFGLVFYPSAIFAGVVLYSLIALLKNIKSGEIFTKKNSSLLRRISWCCFCVAIITLIGGFFYMPFIFIALAGGFVGLMLRVLKNVMQSATELREENDLTI